MNCNLGLKKPFCKFSKSFGFGKTLGQISVSVSAETQNWVFGQSLNSKKLEMVVIIIHIHGQNFGGV